MTTRVVPAMIEGGLPPAGSIIMAAFSTPPEGWLACNGAAVSRSTYSRLFSAIGTAFGVGDGSTTFTLPDLRGRMPIGAGAGSGLTARSLAAIGGAEAVTLTEAQLPAHTHVLNTRSDLTAGGSETAVQMGTMTSVDSGSTGSGTAVPTMSPFAVLGFFIRT